MMRIWSRLRDLLKINDIYIYIYIWKRKEEIDMEVLEEIFNP